MKRRIGRVSVFEFADSTDLLPYMIRGVKPEQPAPDYLMLPTPLRKSVVFLTIGSQPKEAALTPDLGSTVFVPELHKGLR